jgi:hypothetical protein
MNATGWWTAGLVGTPLLIVALLLFFWRRRIDRSGERFPIAEKLLRPAGESLRLKIEVLDEKLMSALVNCILAPSMGAGILLIPIPGFPLARLLAALVAAVALFVITVRRLFSLVNELRAYRLGFYGERAVAEEINQLMRDGCRIFHDVPNEPYGNIDHVIVAPFGVFAVETKTRRKKKVPPGKKDHEVIFDGKALEFPNGRDTGALEQARQQADRLRVFLTKAVGESVAVSPILTLPGWFVSSRVNERLKVVNPKQIRQVVLNTRDAKLAPELIQRISHQLDQICRDVEL